MVLALISRSCLGHITNLATQALIATQSKAKYDSAADEDAHIPDLTTRDRDEAADIVLIVGT